MGGFGAHAEEERQINQEASSSGDAQSELLLSLPGAQLHQVFEHDENLFPLAEGTLTVVSVVLPSHDNRIGLVAKVKDNSFCLLCLFCLWMDSLFLSSDARGK